MARDGNGTYTNPYPDFVAGTTISSDQADANNGEIADALTQSIAVDGQSTITGNIPMATFKFTGLGNGSAATDSLSLGQAQANAYTYQGTDSGAADAYVIALVPAITTQAAGLRVAFVAANASTGASTLNVGGGADAIEYQGAALTGAEIAAGSTIVCEHDGTAWQMTSPSNLLGGGGIATVALDNLAGVALNTALLPDVAAADDFGSATLPFKDFWLAGSSGTPETNNFQITGSSSSGTRVVTLPDASGTVMYNVVEDTTPQLGGTLDGQDETVQNINLLDYGEITNAIGGTGGGTQDIDLELGNSVTATVDTSTNTFTFSNPTASDELCGFTLGLTNGGSQTVNWPASVDWAGGAAPTLTASGYDELVFWTRDGGTIWHGATVSLDSS